MLRRVVWATIFTIAIAFSAQSAGAKPSIVVGGKNFTEQLILAEMTAQYLKAKGFDVSTHTGMSSKVLRQAQLNGEIDLYWEYVGTSLIVYNNVEGGAKMSRGKAYDTVKRLDAKKGLIWLEPSDANNTYAIAMEKKDAKKLGIQTITDLATLIKKGKNISLGANAEFAGRPDGLPGLQKHYGFKLSQDQVKLMNTGLVYNALNEDEVDAAMVFATDGRIPAFDLRILKDNKNFFPSYAITPVVRRDVLKTNNRIRDLMNKLSSYVDDSTMRQLNKEVDVKHKNIEKVSENFLKNNGLI